MFLGIFLKDTLCSCSHYTPMFLSIIYEKLKSMTALLEYFTTRVKVQLKGNIRMRLECMQDTSGTQAEWVWDVCEMRMRHICASAKPHS